MGSSVTFVYECKSCKGRSEWTELTSESQRKCRHCGATYKLLKLKGVS